MKTKNFFSVVVPVSALMLFVSFDSTGYKPADKACSVPYFGSRVDLGKVQYDPIVEASGIDASNKNANVLWLHNDGGHPNCVYAMNTQGKHLGSYYLAGTTNRDWEDIAVGPGPLSGQQYIYVGNIGDNNAVYDYKYIYRVLEPDVYASQDSVTVTLSGVETITFQYPDGRRDAETLMIDPLTRDLYVVSKRESNVMVYRAPYPQSTSQIITLQKVDTLVGVAWALGGDISPSGLEVIIKNTSTIYYWCRTPSQALWEAFNNPRYTLPYIPEPQGEALAFKSDSMGYYTVSEEPDTTQAHLYFYPRLLTGLVEKTGSLPTGFILEQNYPNPFNPATTISFSIPQSSNVKLVIYDSLGREIDILVNGKLEAGKYSYQWNSSHISSGIYFYKLIADDFSEVKAMVVVK